MCPSVKAFEFGSGGIPTGEKSDIANGVTITRVEFMTPNDYSSLVGKEPQQEADYPRLGPKG